ncbi:hypothetical protein [Cyanothece sp. BG0011]|uniref:hypothetical protein n=1 Tax=Cyanothece sp. BG0011 TaxID=2082950 RepID=UPI000D1E9C06|nr:hypothetical protein [Cyanothece sp. BG0011]
MTIGKGQSLNTGKNALNNTKAVLIANPDYLNRKTLLLYDCDTQKPNEDHEYLMIRCLQRRQPAKVTNGIENLIPDELLEDRFYQRKEGKDGGYTMALNKSQLCKWICEERKKPDDFIHFQEIINILQEFIE